MEYGAIDLHKKESQIRIVMEGGESSTDRSRRRVERLTTLFWSRPRMRISARDTAPSAHPAKI